MQVHPQASELREIAEVAIEFSEESGNTLDSWLALPTIPNTSQAEQPATLNR